MVEVLRNSLAMPSYQHHLFASRNHENGSTVMFLNYCCPYLSLDIKAIRWRAVGSLSIGCQARSRKSSCSKFPLKVASIEYGSVSEDQNTLVQEHEAAVDEDPIERKSPPWGNLDIKQCSDSEIIVVTNPSVATRAKDILDEKRVQFLEEKDEEILSARILKLSRSNKVRSALGLYRSMKFSGLRPNLHACNSILSCLLRNKRHDDALIIFEFMKANDMTTGHSYSIMLKGIAEAWGSDAALDMFDDLVGNSDLQKRFDAVVYNTMITVSGKENNWLWTEKIWRKMKYNGHIGTAVTYRLLVCIFVRCGQYELAIDAYHDMVQNGLKPADDAMQAIIGAYVKEGKWDFALQVFENMLNSGMKPNLVTCNALINSLGKGGKVNLAFKIYGVMKSLGHVPDAHTLNGLLVALCRANQHADALRLFESIQQDKSIVLNSHLYSTALMSCQRLGLWDNALQLLWQMEGSGLSTSTASYNLVIGACEVARRPKIALQVYEHMVHQKQSPDTFTLLSIIRGCIWGSLWDEVEEILNRVLPNGSLYNTAIQGFCLSGKIDSAKELYTKMREIGLKPDGKTRAMMLQNLPNRSKVKR